MKILFDWLTGVLRAAQPSLFAFIETTLPYSTPLPVALISSTSVGTFFGLQGFGAFAFVYSLEGIGLVATTKLVDTVVDWIRSRNSKSFAMIVILGIAVIVYIRILISINVTLHENSSQQYSQVLTLICYLPLVAGVLNGLGLVKLQASVAQLRQAELDEQHYQQERQDKKDIKLARINAQAQAGMVPQDVQQDQYANEFPGNYKAIVFEILEQNNGNVGLTDITRLVNETQGTHFIHAKAKGTWFKYVQQWHQEHPRQEQ